jgi:hypothetical protein
VEQGFGWIGQISAIDAEISENTLERTQGDPWASMRA